MKNEKALNAKHKKLLMMSKNLLKVEIHLAKARSDIPALKKDANPSFASSNNQNMRSCDFIDDLKDRLDQLEKCDPDLGSQIKAILEAQNEDLLANRIDKSIEHFERRYDEKLDARDEISDRFSQMLQEYVEQGGEVFNIRFYKSDMGRGQDAIEKLEEEGIKFHDKNFVLLNREQKAKVKDALMHFSTVDRDKIHGFTEIGVHRFKGVNLLVALTGNSKFDITNSPGDWKEAYKETISPLLNEVNLSP